MANDPAVKRTVRGGFLLLAVCLPLGVTLEALHAMKVQVYLGSQLRRELWTLAHAHGNLLGILCLAYGALAERFLPDPARRARIGGWLLLGSALMPAGFFLGGVLNREGDPSWGILLVPAGALCLLAALAGAAMAARD